MYTWTFNYQITVFNAMWHFTPRPAICLLLRNFMTCRSSMLTSNHIKRMWHHLQVFDTMWHLTPRPPFAGCYGIPWRVGRQCWHPIISNECDIICTCLECVGGFVCELQLIQPGPMMIQELDETIAVTAKYSSTSAPPCRAMDVIIFTIRFRIAFP